MALFNIFPLIIELCMVMIIILSLYPFVFFLVTAISVIFYVTATVYITEWRARYFKSLAAKDAEYSQKATDSLLNFETVKYFNAESHEEQRFMKALSNYKFENIRVAKSLVVLNITQSGIIAMGLMTALLIAYHKIIDDQTFKVGDFVMINTYILQMYAPLNFLGTFWRFIRQSMADVELVFELLEIDEKIKEPLNPIPPSI
jgi:ATP-binding cassette subfamily B protein